MRLITTDGNLKRRVDLCERAESGKEAARRPCKGAKTNGG